MVEISFISKEIIQTKQNHGELVNKIDLAPWDLQFLLTYPIQSGLLFHKPTTLRGKELFPTTNVVDHLRLSFSKTLEFFPFLTGRLERIDHKDGTSSFSIECNNAGAYFVHTIINNVKVKDILQSQNNSLVQSLFPMNVGKSVEGISEPLVVVQVNELVDGFFISCTMNHSVADGSSFWYFFNSYSEISSGSDNISRLPIFKCWLPNGIDFPIRIPFLATSFPNAIGESLQPNLEERVFHFSKEKITSLKSKANISTNAKIISSLQAFLAHVWQSILRSQNLEFDQEVIFLIPVDSRKRLEVPLLDVYFANAIVDALVITTAGEIYKEGLGDTAMRLHQAIVSQTNDEIVSSLKGWLSNPIIHSGENPKGFSIAICSPRFNAYGTDFGWGKPIAVRTYLDKLDGAIVLCSGQEEGSISIEVHLSPEKLDALGNNKEFIEAMEFCSI